MASQIHSEWGNLRQKSGNESLGREKPGHAVIYLGHQGFLKGNLMVGVIRLCVAGNVFI